MHPLVTSLINEPQLLTYVLIVCTTAAIIVFEYKKQKVLFPRCGWKAISGPTQMPIIGNIHQMVTFRKEHRLIKCIQFYLRLAPTGIMRLYIFNRLHVFIGVPEYLEAVFGNFRVVKKAEEYKVLNEGPLGSGLITQPDVNVWRMHRKIITPTFHFNILKTYVSVFFEEATILLDKIKIQFGNDNDPIHVPDIKPLVELANFDMILRNAFGVNIQVQKNSTHPFLVAMTQSLEIMLNRLLKPWLLLDILFWLSGYRQQLEDSKKIVYKFTEEVIQEKRRAYETKQSTKCQDNSGEIKNSNDFNGVSGKRNHEGMEEIDQSNGTNDTLGQTNNTLRDNIINVDHKASVHKSFIELILENEDNDVEKMTDEEIRDNMISIIFAGLDTTATTDCMVLLMLALHPEIQSAVIEEIDSIFGGPDKDNGSPPTYDQIMELHTLERIIKETMRLYPAVPTLGRSLMEDIAVGPYVLPTGVNVEVFVIGLHRDPDLHPKADEFWPDRFLPQNSHLVRRFSFIPFGAGSRNCIGQRYAMLQMKTILSAILRQFRVSADKIKSLRQVDELLDIGFTLHVEKCPVILTERRR